MLTAILVILCIDLFFRIISTLSSATVTTNIAKIEENTRNAKLRGVVN